MNQAFNLKQGDTLSIGGYINLPAGTWSIESMVRTFDDVLVDTLESSIVAPTPPDDQYAIALLATPDKTVDWPLGQLYCDVRFTDGALVVTSPTFSIVVLEAQTHDL